MRVTVNVLLINEFLEYFNLQWVNNLNGWYEGYSPDYPSTNNALEATNNVIKKESTLRERLSLGQFFSTLTKMIESWSNERNPFHVNSKFFFTKPLMLFC